MFRKGRLVELVMLVMLVVMVVMMVGRRVREREWVKSHLELYAFPPLLHHAAHSD